VKTGARVHGDVTGLDDEVVLGHHGQLAADDEKVDAHVFHGGGAANQLDVRDDDPLGVDVGGIDSGSDCRGRQQEDAERRSP
jgi:hypothetical protein